MMALAALVLSCWLQPATPELVSGEILRQPPGAHVSSVAESISGTAWVGYRVRGVRVRGRSCDGVVHLEGGGRSQQRGSDDPSHLERFILYRVVDGRVGNVRAVGTGCLIDAAGLPLYWLEGVETADSLRFLDELLRADRTDDVANQALHALSVHGGEQADVKLVALARSDPRTRLRGQALFWLAQRADAAATDAIVEAVVDDPELEIKKKAVFALSQLPPDEGIPLLVDVARTHPSLEVRKRAFFWLGQSGAAEALALFQEVLLTKR